MKLKAIIDRVEERFERRYDGGIGPDAKFSQVSIGWWMSFKGSNTSIHVGQDRPSEMEKGDRVIVTIERDLSNK